MKIIRNEELQTWTLVPIEGHEIETLASIIAVLEPGGELSYGGRSRDGETRKFCVLHLHVGAKREERSETKGNVTIYSTEYVGGIKLVLCGSTEEDKDAVWSVRHGALYSGHLVLLDVVEVDGKQSIVTTAGHCKHCGANLLETEWKTCDACAAKCEHVYIRGAIHGGGTDIGVGEFCSICGRGKPKPEGERKKSIIEQHLDVENELGIPVLHEVEGCPPVSSKNFVEMNRTMRRYAKSLKHKVSA